MERTLAIIKPDAVERGLTIDIIDILGKNRLLIVAARRLTLSIGAAYALYREHAEQSYFESQLAYMTSGPCVALILEGPNAVARWRALMGPTNPADAVVGTIRWEYAQTLQRNSVHGSDSIEAADREIRILFPGYGQLPQTR